MTTRMTPSKPTKETTTISNKFLQKQTSMTRMTRTKTKGRANKNMETAQQGRPLAGKPEVLSLESQHLCTEQDMACEPVNAVLGIHVETKGSLGLAGHQPSQKLGRASLKGEGLLTSSSSHQIHEHECMQLHTHTFTTPTQKRQQEKQNTDQYSP